MLSEKRLRDLLDAFASPDPTPGGGSAAALSGALGASLLAMVAGLPKTKHNTPEDRAALDVARARLTGLQSTLIDLVDRDAAAYDRVVAAFKLPKATDDEKAARKAAVQDAFKHATEVPLETLRACAEALDAAAAVVASGNPSAVSDIAVAIQTLMVGQSAALLNIQVNLESVVDQTFMAKVTSEIRFLMERAGKGMMAMMQSPELTALHTKSGALLGARQGEMPANVPPEMFAKGAVGALIRLRTPEARQALEILARSADKDVARIAGEGLRKKDEDGAAGL